MDDKVITRIKEKIKLLLKEKGMTIYELSLKAEVADPTIRNWFNKRNYIPNLDSLIKICEVFKISLSELTLSDNEIFYPVNEETREMLDDWKMLTPNQQEIVKSVIKSYKVKRND